MTGSVDPLAFSVAQSLQAGPGFNQFYSIFGQNPSVGAQAAFKSAPRKAPRRESGVKEPPTFSGFENLRTLGVLEIDDLEVVPEIHAAVHKSHKTLTKLKLSFSDTLAAKARNPIPITVDIDDIDVDEEFQTTNGPAAAISASHSSVGGAAKSNLVEEERKIQDEVLGQIFGIDRPASRRMQKQWGSDDFSTTDTPKAASLAGNEDDSEARLYLFRDLVNKLAAAFNANDGAEGWQRRLFDLLASATTGPDGGSLGAQFAEEQSGTHDSPASQRVAASEENASQSGAGPAEPDVAAPMAAESEPWGPKWTFKDDTAIESVVDIERPETVELAELLGEDGQDSGPKLVLAAQTPTSTKKVPAIHIEKTLAAQKAKFESMAENLKDLETQANELSERLGTLGLDTDVDSNASTTTTAAVPEDDQSAKGVHQRQQFMDKIEPHAHEVKGLEALVAEYIRTTRPALGLKSLAIHLIPVKASVLSQAVNLRTLKRLTLLNVGPQGPIWDMLAKQNRVAPLALQKIFTDNVTVKFLSCVCELREVKELFMLERSAKETPGSFADPTNITIDDVRRSVLKVHLPHLKRLMIKNDDTTKWDVDERTMAAICKKGKKLEELAVSMGIRTMVRPIELLLFR